MQEKSMSEGILAWKQLDWLLDKNNTIVVHNISYFLPDMLNHKKPARYQCHFEGSTFVTMTQSQISKEVTID